MSPGRFTVLLPITRPPAFLPFAVEAVLGQTHSDFELFIISDGAPATTIEWVREAAKRDARVRLFDFPKGERHGEAHRHSVLQEATGTFVAQIADDDLWFPEYLSEMALHLRTVDFGNLIQCTVDANGAIDAYAGDLGAPNVRERMMLTGWNFFGPTVTGYRISAYRQMEGWSAAPAGIPTDLHMWRKFLANPRFKVGTRFAIQSVGFPTPQRTKWSEARRAAEIAAFAKRLQDPEARRDIAAEGLRAVYAAGRRDIAQEATVRMQVLAQERDMAQASLNLVRSRAQPNLPWQRSKS